MASAVISRLQLHLLSALAKHPFANVGRTLNQFNALILAVDQEANHPEIY
jgi:hypothetical protein